MNKTALIVDDDRSVLRNFNRLLTEKGYNVSASTTGTEALNLIKKHRFELILIDYRLPDMDGVELLKKMGHKVDKAIKIMITGFPTIESSIKALDAGIDSYIEKPVNLDTLCSLIEEIENRKNIKK